MNMNTLGGILVGATLALGWQTSMAAEAGKTAASELSRDANASLKQLYASVPQAKSLGPKATAILVFPKVTQGRPGRRRSVRRRRARQLRTTTPRARRSGCRPAPSNTATRCSS
jgi:hypothetical protein